MLGLVGPPSAAGLPAFQHLIAAPHSLRYQADKGCVLPGSPPGHRDSWGIGWFDQAGRVSLVREVGSAADSAFYVFGAEASGRDSAGSGPATILIGHLRKAVSGAVVSQNAHPVRVDRRDAGPMLVAHNGHVRESLLASLRDDLWAARNSAAEADCDTVVLAHWLGLARADSPICALRDALSDLLARARDLEEPDEAYTGLNLLIGLPEGMAVLRHFSRAGDYYTLYSRPVGESWLIASERTDPSPEWELLPAGMLSFYAADGSRPQTWTLA